MRRGRPPAPKTDSGMPRSLPVFNSARFTEMRRTCWSVLNAEELWGPGILISTRCKATCRTRPRIPCAVRAFLQKHYWFCGGCVIVVVLTGFGKFSDCASEKLVPYVLLIDTIVAAGHPPPWENPFVPVRCTTRKLEAVLRGLKVGRALATFTKLVAHEHGAHHGFAQSFQSDEAQFRDRKISTY